MRQQEGFVHAVDVNQQMVAIAPLIWLPTVDVAVKTSRARPPS